MMKQNIQKLNCTWLYYRSTRSLYERVKKKAMGRKRKEKTVDFFLSFTVLKQTAWEQMVNDLSFIRTKRMKQMDSEEFLLVSTVVDILIDDKSTLEWLSTKRKTSEWLIYEKNMKDKTMLQSSTYNRDRMESKLDRSKKNKKSNSVTLNNNKNWIITSDNARIYCTSEGI